MQKILSLLFLALLSYSPTCLANDDYTFNNPDQFNVSLKQIYEEVCKEHIQYVKNLRLYQIAKKVGKKVEKKANYQKTFYNESANDNKSKPAPVCNFKSGIKFDSLFEPYSYFKTELKVFSFRIYFEGRLSIKKGEEVRFFLEKRF